MKIRVPLSDFKKAAYPNGANVPFAGRFFKREGDYIVGEIEDHAFAVYKARHNCEKVEEVKPEVKDESLLVGETGPEAIVPVKKEPVNGSRNRRNTKRS